MSTAIDAILLAVLSESSDNSNHAFGMSVITCAMSTGYVFGPAVSGALSDPIGQYNLTISGMIAVVVHHLHHLYTIKFPHAYPPSIPPSLPPSFPPSLPSFLSPSFPPLPLS